MKLESDINLEKLSSVSKNADLNNKLHADIIALTKELTSSEVNGDEAVHMDE